MDAKTKAKLVEAVGIIQNLVECAYEGSEARVEIKPDGIDIIGGEGEELELSCTPTRAIERLIEDQS